MGLLAGEHQCEVIISHSRRQCDNKVFALINNETPGSSIGVCRLHLAYRAKNFKPEAEIFIFALNPEDQKDADTLVKFITKT